MKKITSIFKYVFLLVIAYAFYACVQDDKYDTPDLDGFACKDASYYEDPKNGFTKWTLEQIKAKPLNQVITDKAYIEGYVSSSDQSGNIYKYIYIQDALENPTQGFTLSVNSLNNYTRYPQGSKIFIEVQGLAVGQYGSVTQLGAMGTNETTGVVEFGRVPENVVYNKIFRSCTQDESKKLVPLEMTLSQMTSSNDKLLGALIKIKNAEFVNSVLCNPFAPKGLTVDRPIADPSTSTTRIVRNSGYASFANKTLPAGKGDFVGIFSKYNSTYQMYIVNDTDLNMNAFPRKDGLTASPCNFDPTGLNQKTIANIKALYTSGNPSQITSADYITATITANDETANLLSSIYVQDASGGIRIMLSKSNSNGSKSLLFQEDRFKVGRKINIKLKDLYIGKIDGEYTIGSLNGTAVNYIAEANIYKYFFDTNETAPIAPLEKTISTLSPEDVGKWIKIKNVEVTKADMYKSYAVGAAANRTIRTLQDCSGNTLNLSTKNNADFAGEELDDGKGDVYGVLSYAGGKYQLILQYQKNADFDYARCDGTVPLAYEIIHFDGFNNLNNWTAVNVKGVRVWTTTTFGNPAPSAYMDGNRQENEDWLISKKIPISTVYKDAYFSFQTDSRYSGNDLQVFVTDNYTGDVATTTWTAVTAMLDPDNDGFNGFVRAGRINVNSFIGKDLVVAFKYTSTNGFSRTYEIDNFIVKGSK